MYGNLPNLLQYEKLKNTQMCKTATLMSILFALLKFVKLYTSVCNSYNEAIHVRVSHCEKIMFSSPSTGAVMRCVVKLNFSIEVLHSSSLFNGDNKNSFGRAGQVNVSPHKLDFSSFQLCCSSSESWYW